MKHVTYESDMSRIHGACHIWMSHGTYMDEWCHIWMRHVTKEWVIPHMKASRHTRTSHVTHESVISHTNESCHIWMSNVTHECVTSQMKQSRHTRTSHFPHLSGSLSLPHGLDVENIVHFKFELRLWPFLLFSTTKALADCETLRFKSFSHTWNIEWAHPPCKSNNF